MPNCIKIANTETTDTVFKDRTRNTAQFPCFRKSVYKCVNMSLSRFSDWLKRSSTNEYTQYIYRSALLTHFWVSKIWRAASMTSRPRASDEFRSRPTCGKSKPSRKVCLLWPRIPFLKISQSQLYPRKLWGLTFDLEAWVVKSFKKFNLEHFISSFVRIHILNRLSASAERYICYTYTSLQIYNMKQL